MILVWWIADDSPSLPNFVSAKLTRYTVDNWSWYNCATMLLCNHYSGPPPYEEADCKHACWLTYCEACYYSPSDPLPPPPSCEDPSTDDDDCNGCLCCLKEWARCTEQKNERDNPVCTKLF